MIGTALVCLLLALSGLPAPASSQSAISPEEVEEIGVYLERLEALGLAGVVVVTEGAQPVLAEALGLADREDQRPWTAATVSTIGSITKQFTGAAILRLAEQGRLSVDEPITEYFEDVPPDKQGITLHHLLTHSSGIVDLDGFGDFDPIGRQEFVRRILEQELAFAPGEGYEYSNAGYSLLGAVIEQLAGTSYESWLRKHLLAPYGLYETGYLEPDWGEGRLAQGYRDGELWGTVVGRPMADDGPYWVLRANGGIHSTAWDMVRWGQALLDGRAISAASMELYWAPHVDEGGGDSHYGYGWVVTDVGGTPAITHNGGNGIFFADMAIVPEAELVIFLMTNVAAEFPLVEQLLEQVGYRLLADQPLPAVPQLVAVERGTLEPWTGIYRLGEEAAAGRLEVSVTDRSDGLWELTIEPLDAEAFGHLLSTRPYDAARAERLSARIDAIWKAGLAGDFELLATAYRGEVSAEYLAERWAEHRSRLEATRGALAGHRILGTAFREGRDVTLVRFEFADGWAYRAYVWDPESEERLLGVSGRGLDHLLHALPGPGGRLATWDSRTGESRPVRFDRLEGGDRRLIVGEDPVISATAP